MNYHKIDMCNMNNGDGLRVVVWLSGCNHYCEGCFNSETWDPCSGGEFGDEQVKLILSTLDKDWCSGITLTGGDPLYPGNRKAVYNLCKLIKDKFPTKTIWIYTGYVYSSLVESKDELVLSILNLIDVLVDGPYIKALNSPSEHWVGSSNQTVHTLKVKSEA